jgi:D-alanyl-lipoteichoic acid acyltransferase DltB (MBOAT superfamily)
MPPINWTDFSGLWTYVASRPLLFSNLEFFILFFIFYTLYLLLLRSFNLRLLLTTIFSLFFYYKCTGGPVNLWVLYTYPFMLLVFSTVVDFFLGHFIYKANGKAGKLFFLILSLVFNLGMLVYFKYTNFFIGIINSSFHTDWALQNIYLPAGISFFVFQTLSYSLDVYRGLIKPVSSEMKDFRSFLRSFLDFGFFVTFFPQLLAGPIVRAYDFLPQIRRKPILSNEQMSRALILIMGGLLKKTIISDYISINFVDRVFENPSLYSGLENLVATYGYAIQIYCDFSGYSDMAIGLALLLGFTLPDNFHTPYRSSSIQEFWRRWHISLSSWLRDYLYISLGGNRKGKFFTYFNLMITMVLGGLWHGASWVFIAWGALHGVALAIDRAMSDKSRFWGNPAMRAFIIVVMVQGTLQFILYTLSSSGGITPEQLSSLTWANLVFFSLSLLLTLLATAVDVMGNRLILGPWVGTFLTFHFVTFCWILFRAGALNNPNPPLDTTAAVLTQIGSSLHPELWGQLWGGYKQVLLLIGLGYLLHFLPTRWYTFWDGLFERSPAPVKSLVLAFVVWLVIQTASADIVPFIYFQF